MKRKTIQLSIAIISVLAISGTIIGVYLFNPSIFHQNGNRTITDGLGRSVNIPSNPQRIVGINAGTLRLLCYLDLVDKIAGVETIENTSAVRPYNFAYPELGNLPIIGPTFGGDPELIVSVNPDVIFATYMEVGDADTLQQQTGIPVVVLNYGDL
ncbi:MAG: iron ABC transporter substrate-binding protein, partial [Promethearchaeota archaeon]